MKIRLKRILIVLLSCEHTTVKEIAIKLNLSEKTIRNELKDEQIITFLEKYYLQLDVVRGRGIQINGSRAQKQQAQMYLEIDTDDIRKVLLDKREAYIIFELLFSPKHINITKLESKLYISQSLIYTSVKQVKKYAQEYEIDLVREKNLIKICGEEKRIRSFMYDFVINLYSQSGDMYKQLLELIEKDKVDLLDHGLSDISSKIDKFIEEIQSQFAIEFYERSISALQVRLLIIYIRIKNGNLARFNQATISNLSELNYDSQLRNLACSYEQIFDYPLDNIEQLYLLGEIASLQIQNKMQRMFVLNTTKLKINKINMEFQKDLLEAQINLGSNDIDELETTLTTIFNARDFEAHNYQPHTFDQRVMVDFDQYSQKLISKINQQVKDELNKYEEKLISNLVRTLLFDYQKPVNVVLILDQTNEAQVLMKRIMAKYLINANITATLDGVAANEIPANCDLAITTKAISIGDCNCYYLFDQLCFEKLMEINSIINNIFIEKNTTICGKQL